MTDAPTPRDDVTTWKAAYLSLLDSWVALCEWADVEGDSAPAEVYAAILAKAALSRREAAGRGAAR